METLGKRHRAPNLHQKAGFFMKHTHWYLAGLLKRGYKHTLQQEDMFEIPKDENANNVSRDLERYWEMELLRKKDGKKPRLAVALAKFVSPQILLFGFIVFTADVLGILQTLLLGWLLDCFAPSSTKTITEAYIYAGCLGLCSFLITLMLNPHFLESARMGMRLKIGTTSMIYRKVLQLSSSAFHSTSTGKIVNLASTDVQRIETAPMYVHYAWIGPVDAIAVLVILWYRLGPSCLAGLGFMFLFIPVNGVTARWFAWLRKETKYLESFLKLQALINSMFTLLPYAVSLLIFTTYVVTGNELTVSKVFSTVTLLQFVRLPIMILFPKALGGIAESYISLTRIQEFLELEEMKKLSNEHYTHPESRGEPVGKLENVSAAWGKTDQMTLSDISLNLDRSNSLIMVIGAVGSGKSSLLMTLLGELPPSNGKVTMSGKIGYVSQQPWVFSGTVRQNILFGSELQLERYNAVIKACSLTPDLALFPDGDLSLVGERGVSLSGGQKARIALARAVYCDADIYLLDDPLSAVDAQVGKEILENCIRGLLKEKVCILVTHQLQYLSAATEILCLKEGGILMRGSYEDLKACESDLVSLISEELDTTIIESQPERKHHSVERKTRSISAVSALSQTSIKDLGLMLEQLEDDFIEDEVEVKIKGGHQEGIAKDESAKALIGEEARSSGSVKVSLYVDYFKAGAGIVGSLLVFLLCIIGQINLFLVDWWLAVWAKGQEAVASARKNNGTVDVRFYFKDDRDLNIYIFLGLTLLGVVLNMARVLAFYQLILRASKHLHNLMFRVILRAPIYFFDTNPVGRILNRFSKDIFYMDDLMSVAFFDFVQLLLLCIGIVIVNVIVTPIVIAVVLPLLVVFLFLRTYFIKSSREIRRLEAVARSPLFSHLSATLQGLVTIRAYGMQENSMEEFSKCQNYQSEGWMMFLLVSRWFAIQADSTCSFFISTVAVTIVVASQFTSIDAAIAGLALSYATGLTGMLQWAVRQSCEVENMMTSVERVIEYTKLEVEQDSSSPVKLPDNWPNAGAIQVNDAAFRYHKTSNLVLKNLTFDVKGNEKVGIVGRTGAGKSSLMAMLFRMADYSGSIVIDGISTRDLLLKDLRCKISVIPQDPVLFCGTLRKNLDPFKEYTDSDIWNSLEEVQLNDAISQLPHKLMTELAEAGANFSVGQRQLICLARAILRQNKILFVDEATANVDTDTDQLIQETIREKFKDCTVLTIAHRLNTIMDSDRVMVLDKGCLVEFDEPHILLQTESSIFTELVRQTGKATEEKLRRLAKEAYNLRHDKLTSPLRKSASSRTLQTD